MPDADRGLRREHERVRDRRRVLRQRAFAVGAVAVAAALVTLAVSGGSGEGHHSRAVVPIPTTASSPSVARKPRTGRVGHRTGSTAASGPIGRPGRVRVPILTYHVIASPPPNAPFPALYVPAAEFRDQVHALARAGFVGVTLDQVQAYWQHGVPLPKGKPIVLTFDNGYHSQYSNALPVLKEVGWVADENIQLAGLPPSQGGLTRREVQALVDAGWELDTQGFNHADLITLTESALRHEVETSRKVLQRRYHVPVNWFCYPSGHYDQTVVDMVRHAGYVGSTTTITGWSSRSQDPYRLERIRALGGVSGGTLVSQIEAARAAGPPPASYSGG